MTFTNKPRILCVDDDTSILEGLEMNLRLQWNVTLAESAQQALDILQEQQDFAVILSDMRMPGMNGADFLAHAREISPHSVRLLLTGYTDIESAISAVNNGYIFRFLTKPCPQQMLQNNLVDALKQYRLIKTEHELLEKTLSGSIKALTEVLSLTNPNAFSASGRIHQYVVNMCDSMQIKKRWIVEIASMVSQLGTIMLSDETAEKHYKGKELTDSEKKQVENIPHFTEKLLSNIPRLEPVLELLNQVEKSDAFMENIDLQILRIAQDFDELGAHGMDVDTVIDTLKGRQNRYNTNLLETFCNSQSQRHSNRNIQEMALQEVKQGMVFANDVLSANGALLVGRGQQVSASLVERLKSFRGNLMTQSVLVIVATVSNK